MTEQRVMRIITRLNVGGPARQAILLTGSLRARGYISHLVWGSVSRREGELSVPQGASNTHAPELRRELRPFDDVRAAQALVSLIRGARPLIVHTHLAKAGALGRTAAWRARVPVVVHTFHGHTFEGYFSAPKRRTFLAAERWLAKRTDCLIAVSSAVRDDLLALQIGTPDQWRVIPLGLDLGELLESRVDPAQARRALNLPEHGPIVGIVGRLTAIKDHETFLRAAARITHARPGVTFVVAGDGELRPKLEAEAKVLLGDKCRFLGWVFDLPMLYAALDVVVLTSRIVTTRLSS